MKIKYNTLSLLLSVAFMCQSLSAYAWGAKGHKMIASIAYHFIDKSVKDSVNKYLVGTSIEDASVWMDEIKGNRSLDYMKPMHYINIEKGKPYHHVEGANIINELHSVIGKLKSGERSNDSMLLYLRELIHLVGDLHQPLHVGYGDDKGGNDVQVSFFGKGTNLHRIWDFEIIEQGNITKHNCMELKSTLSGAKIKKIRKGSVEGWMEESRAYLPSIYQYKSNKIGQEYLDKHAPIVKKQILFGGLRLAHLLNDVFK
jgi:hypothetical protein